MDAPEETRDKQYQELRRKFRDTALHLSSACDSSVGWETAQRILEHIWDVPNTESGQPILYACQACGFVLHPGFLGTTLRLARSKRSDVSRTRRRREQRRKRKESIAKQKQKKDSSAQKNIDSLPKIDNKVVILEDDPCVVFDRHHLVITCGRCRSSVRCKGLKREASNSRSLPAIETSWNFAQKKQTATPINPTSDFVKLPPFAEKPANTLIQTDQRKKKKKAPPKSNLLNFLNSLND